MINESQKGREKNSGDAFPGPVLSNGNYLTITLTLAHTPF